MYTRCDIPELMESINERFDSAMEHMLPGTFIFGNVLRNLIAGIVPDSTLHMLMGYSEFKLMINAFSKSSKWLTTTPGPLKREAGYVNMYGANVRLVSVDTPTITPYRITEYSNNLRCNCLVMDHNGMVLEVVPGAYKDCQNKELHLSGEAAIANVEAFDGLIQNYLKEGWINKIPRKQYARKSGRAKPVKPKPILKSAGVGKKAVSPSLLHQLLNSVNIVEDNIK